MPLPESALETQAKAKASSANLELPSLIVRAAAAVAERNLLTLISIGAIGQCASLSMQKDYVFVPPPSEDDEAEEPVDPDKLVFEGKRYGGAFEPKLAEEE